MKLAANNPLLVGIALLLIAGAIVYIESGKAGGKQVNEELGKNSIQEDLEKKAGLYPLAREFRGIQGHINAGNDFNLQGLKGKVVMVDFWTYSCINCIRTLPYLTAWDEKYRDKGLVIVGVHTPEFEFEKDYNNVLKAVKNHGINYPVLLDNQYATWRAYNNHYWPHKYLIDADGYVRFDHIGEGAYEETEKVIQELLKERDSRLEIQGIIAQTIKDTVDESGIGSPEIYLGYGFARQGLGNREGFQPEKNVPYTLPESFEKNLAYLEGEWANKSDYMELVSGTGKIVLKYEAKAVNIVAGMPAMASIRLDGSELLQEQAGMDAEIVDGKAIAEVKDLKLYNLVTDIDYFEKTIEITVTGKGFRIYTFTFG